MRKLKKTSALRMTILSFSTVTLLATVGACGRTSGGSDQQLLEIASKSANRLKASNAGGVESLTKRNTEAMERLLRGLIDKEREERKAADEALSARIDALETELRAFKAQVQSQFKAVDERDQLLRDELAKKFDALSEADKSLADKMSAMEKSALVTAEALRSEIEMAKKDLSTELNAKISAVNERISSLESSINSQINDLKNVDATLGSRLESLNKDVSANKADADAQIAALNSSLQEAVAKLSADVSQARLDAKADASVLDQKLAEYQINIKKQMLAQDAAFSIEMKKRDQDLRAALNAQKNESDARFKKMQSDLQKQSEALNANIESSVKNLKTEMSALVASTDAATRVAMNAQIEALASKSGDELKAAREELISSMKNQSAEAQMKMAALALRVEGVKQEGERALQELDERLKKQIKGVEDFARSEASAVRAEIAMQVEQLKNQIVTVQKSLSTEFKKGLSELSDRQTAALDGYKLEQIAQLKQLKNQTASAMSAITALGSDFNVYKEAQAQVVSSLNSRMETGLKDVESRLSNQTKASVEAIRQDMKMQNDNLLRQMSAVRGEMAEVAVKLRSEMSSKYDELQNNIKGVDDKLKAEIVRSVESQKALEAKWEESKSLIQMKIAALNADLSASQIEYDRKLAEQEAQNRVALELERNTRAEELKKLEADLKTVNDAQKAARTKLEEELKTKLLEASAENATVINNLKGQLQELDNRTLVTYGDLKKELANERVKTELSIASGMKAIEQKIVAETAAVAARVEAVAQAQEDFKAFVAKNYTTKGELAAVELRVKGLEDVTKIMNAKFDETNAELRAMISSEVAKAKDELASRIQKVEATVDGVKTKLGGAIDDYQKQIFSLKSEMSKEIESVRGDMKAQDDAMYAKLNESEAAFKDLNADLMGKIRRQAANFEAMSQGIKKELSDKLVALDAQINATDTALKAEQAAVQAKFAEVVKQEQAVKEQLTRELAQLKNDLKEVANVANQSLALARQNQEETKLLKASFEEQKTEVAKKFNLQGEQITKLNTAMQEMKADFNKRLQQVANDAAEMVENLGADVQENFKKVATDIAQIRAREKAIEAKVNSHLSDLKLSATATSAFQSNIRAPQKAAAQELGKTLKAVAEVRTAFLRALNPQQPDVQSDGKLGARKEFYDISFVPIMTQCGGRADASFANAFGRDSFDFLADEYISALLFDARGSTLDPLYFGQAKQTDGANMHHYVMLESMRLLEGGNDDPSCMSRIKSWSRSVLGGNDKNSVALRKKLTDSVEFKRSVGVLVTAVSDLKPKVEAVETIVKSAIRTLPNAETVLQVGQGDEQLPLLARYANTLVEAAENAFSALERQEDFNQMVEIQKNFAKENSELLNRINVVESRLNANLDSFKNQTTAQIDALKSEDAAIKSSVGKALDVLMSLALRSGQPELVAATLDAGKSIAYVPKPVPRVEPKILEIQHFFSSPALASNSDVCTGATIRSGAGVKFWSAQGTMQCWVNFRGIPNSQRAGTASTIWFRIFGAAETIRVRADRCDQGANSSCDFNYRFNDASAMSSGTKVTGAPSEGVFDIRMPGVLQPYIRRVAGHMGGYMDAGWWGEVVNFTASRSDGSGAVSSAYRIQLYSPLVLDFEPVGRPSFASQQDSRVSFDLDGDGRRERTGWMVGAGKVGLLALDLNSNGIVDDGRELFGEATRLTDTGRKARDGYAALAQYDSNKDGVIDAKDRVYADLKIWFDGNSNGRTDAGELVRLSDAGVTKIGLQHTALKDQGRFVNGNELRTTAKFWGPNKCGDAGCNSYDVYFGTSFTVSKRK